MCSYWHYLSNNEGVLSFTDVAPLSSSDNDTTRVRKINRVNYECQTVKNIEITRIMILKKRQRTQIIVFKRHFSKPFHKYASIISKHVKGQFFPTAESICKTYRILKINYLEKLENPIKPSVGKYTKQPKTCAMMLLNMLKSNITVTSYLSIKIIW